MRRSPDDIAHQSGRADFWQDLSAKGRGAENRIEFEGAC